VRHIYQIFSVFFSDVLSSPKSSASPGKSSRLGLHGIKQL